MCFFTSWSVFPILWLISAQVGCFLPTYLRPMHSLATLASARLPSTHVSSMSVQNGCLLHTRTLKLT
jgi:hypothetical protein